MILDHPEVALAQVGRNDMVVERTPDSADLIGLGEGFYLDFPGSSLSPGCIFECDFQKYSGDHPATTAGPVVASQPNPSAELVSVD